MCSKNSANALQFSLEIPAEDRKFDGPMTECRTTLTEEFVSGPKDRTEAHQKVPEQYRRHKGAPVGAPLCRLVAGVANGSLRMAVAGENFEIRVVPLAEAHFL